MRAWHWLREDMTSKHGDELAWTEGETRTIKGRKKIVICQHGYHASPTPWDGIKYAPGPVLCLVETGAPVAYEEDKYVSHTRTLIKAVNVAEQLRLFACDVAEEALNLEVEQGHTVDERSRAAVEVARRYVRGLATQQDLEAAKAVAIAVALAAEPRTAVMALAAQATWAAACPAAEMASWTADMTVWAMAGMAVEQKANFNLMMEGLFV